MAKCRIVDGKEICDKDNKMVLWIILAVIGVVAIYLFASGTIKFPTGGLTIGSTDTPYVILPTSIAAESSALSLVLNINPQTGCTDDSMYVSITSNMPNSQCSAYFKGVNTEWVLLENLVLSNQGTWTKTTDVGGQVISGILKVVCYANGQYKTSNEKAVSYVDCQQQPNQPNLPIPDNNPALTCQQKAAQAGAQYSSEPQTSNSCKNFAIMSCQDIGKTLSGWAILDTCCYWNCDDVIPQQAEPIICHDSDSQLSLEDKLLTVGTCHDNTQEVSDSCSSGMLREYGCNADNNNIMVCGYTSANCEAIIPGTVCYNGACVNANSFCAQSCDALQGYSTGACFAYNPFGALSMQMVCNANNGDYAGVTGTCGKDSICCCR